MFKLRQVMKDWILPTGVRVFDTHDAMCGDRIRLMEQLAYEYGQYSDSYLVTEPNRSYLWSSCDRGVVGFVRQGRYLNIVGGLITRDAIKPRFLEEISLLARLNKLKVTFFHVDDGDLPLFRSQGYQVTKFGMDARISLSNHNWNGKPFEWVRRQLNFVSRQGIVCEEWSAKECSPAEWNRRLAELHKLSAEHSAARHFKGEIPFFEGQLLDDHIYRRRIFVARANNGQGRVEGFILCSPIKNGRHWALELYRHRQDAIRGVIPFLMHQTIERFKAEGCDGVSMCPLPAIGCETKLPGDSFVVRLALILWNKLGNALFDTKGLYHFKSRFRPEYRDIFICSMPNASVGLVWTYMNLVKAFDLKIGAFLKDLIHQLNPQRRTLAKPVFAPQSAVAANLESVSVAAEASSETKAA